MKNAENPHNDRRDERNGDGSDEYVEDRIPCAQSLPPPSFLQACGPGEDILQVTRPRATEQRSPPYLRRVKIAVAALNRTFFLESLHERVELTRLNADTARCLGRA